MTKSRSKIMLSSPCRDIKMSAELGGGEKNSCGPVSCIVGLVFFNDLLSLYFV